MNKTSRAILGSALLVMTGVASAGTVTVNFVDPQGFTDAGTTSWDQKANLDMLARHLQSLGQRLLPAEQQLKIDVLDVKLAGELRPGLGGNDIRKLRGQADWPRIKLRYVLQAPGQPARTGQEVIEDLDYLHGLQTGRDWESLYSEKRMLDAWFKMRFVPAQSAAEAGATNSPAY